MYHGAKSNTLLPIQEGDEGMSVKTSAPAIKSGSRRFFRDADEGERRNLIAFTLQSMNGDKQ